MFGSLDDYLWKLSYKWATWRHSNKPKFWIVGRYFGKFNKFRNDHWVFGDRDTGAYLVKFSWTGIERHVPVKGAASPDDPALAAYWAEAAREDQAPAGQVHLRLLTGSTGYAPCAGTTCSAPLSHPSLPSSGRRGGCSVTRKAIAASYLTHHGQPSTPHDDRTRLVHASCQRAQPGPPAQEPGASTRDALAARLSRVRGQPARTVLRRRWAQQCARRYPTGHYPLLAFCDNTGGEPLGGCCEKGSAGSNTAAGHIQIADASIAALPPAWRRNLMVTADGAGFSHKLLEHLDALAARRGYTLAYSCGWELDAREKAAIRLVPGQAWQIAVDHRGEVRERRADDACAESGCGHRAC